VNKKIIEFDVIKKNIDKSYIFNRTIKEIKKIFDVDVIIIIAVFYDSPIPLTRAIGLSYKDAIKAICLRIAEIEVNRYKNQKKISKNEDLRKISKDLRINLNAKGVIIAIANSQKKVYLSCSSGLSRREKILVFISSLIDISDELPNL